jgi:hypothetical protein
VDGRLHAAAGPAATQLQDITPRHKIAALAVVTGIGALIAAPLVSLGGYPTLFAGTAVVGLLGSILVWRIKSVP